MQFPDDENGDVLRRMHDSGMDLSLSYEIDFYHFFQDEKSAESMCLDIKKNSGDVKAKILKNEEQQGWDVCCTLYLIPTHENITNTELFYEQIAKKYNGHSDGWGVLQE